MEHQRTTDNVGDIWQWYDTEQVMVLDAVTGEARHFGEPYRTIGTLSDALEYVRNRRGWEDRMVIVHLNCIIAGRIVEEPEP